MNFASYADYRVSFIQLADGDDTSDAAFSVSTADLMIALGESRVCRDLRASSMVMPLSIAPVAGVYSLPADLIELKEIYFSGKPPIEIVPLDKLRKLIASGTSPGQVCYAAQDGDALVFWPAETTATVIGSYYAKPEALKTITWADATTFARYPEVFLFAALAECAEFLGFKEKQAAWEQKYMQKLNAAHHDEQVRVYGGSPLRVRAR